MLETILLHIGTGGLSSALLLKLAIDYSTAVKAASAQIWDIDGHSNGTEQWWIQALGLTNDLLDTIFSPIGNDPWFKLT